MTKIFGLTRFQWIIGALVVSGLAAAILGFGITSKSTIRLYFQSSGYYFVFGTFLLWIFTLAPKSLDWPLWKARLKRHGWALGISAVLAGSAVLSSPPQFRILADETNLIAIASAIYDDKTFYNPTQGTHYYHQFTQHKHEWGKRPIFFPFLVAVVHTFLGYDAYNVFVLNAIAGALCLFLMYLLLQRWFSRGLAFTGMIWLAAVPLFLLWVTAAGFEIVNLLFVLLSFLLLDSFLVTKRSYYVEALGLTLVLLAQVRYESALFTLCIVPVVLFHMRRPQYESLTYRSVLLPLLFLPVAWQRILNLNNKYQMKDGKPAFDLEWLQKNTAHAWDFFSGKTSLTGADTTYATIPVIFYLAIAGLLYGAYWCFQNRDKLSARAVSLLAVLLSSTLFQCLILFTYYWGNLKLQYAMRLGIIFLPALIFAGIWLLSHVVARWSMAKPYVVASGLALVLFYWPIAAKNEAVNQIFLHREYRYALEYLHKNHPDRHIMIVSNRPGMYTPHRWGAVNFAYARKNHKQLTRKLKRNLFTDIIVIQRILYSTKKPEKKMKLPFKLKTLHEIQHGSKSFIRFSKVLP